MNNIQNSYLTIGYNFEKLDKLDLANDFYCKTLEEYSFFKYKYQEIYRLKNNLKSQNLVLKTTLLYIKAFDMIETLKSQEHIIQFIKDNLSLLNDMNDVNYKSLVFRFNLFIDKGINKYK